MNLGPIDPYVYVFFAIILSLWYMFVLSANETLKPHGIQLT